MGWGGKTWAGEEARAMVMREMKRMGAGVSKFGGRKLKDLSAEHFHLANRH